MVTLQIDGGKKQKLRAGDILGALTAKDGITGKQVGKIQLFPNKAYVAVNRDVAEEALRKITHGQLKGRTFRAKQI
jgi:ATP-independent RNA helicase DbpA